MPIDPRTVTYIIDALWLLLAAYWTISAFGNKRSVYRQPRIERLAYLVGFLVVIFLIVRTHALEIPIFRRTLFTQIEASIWREEELRAEMTRVGEAPRAERAERAERPDSRPHEGSWLMPFRRWDGYREAVEAALKQLRRRGPERSEERARDRVEH